MFFSTDYKPQLPKESNTGKTERRKENIAQQPGTIHFHIPLHIIFILFFIIIDISEQQSTSHTGENEEPDSEFNVHVFSP